MPNVPTPPNHGANLRVVKDWCNLVGCNYHIVNGTGDIRFSHPVMPNTIKQNCRLIYSTRIVTSYMKKVYKKLSSTDN
ncbi:hypothetical protein BH11PLA2_BH11PLA2_52640 [soil metagenome]